MEETEQLLATYVQHLSTVLLSNVDFQLCSDTIRHLNRFLIDLQACFSLNDIRAQHPKEEIRRLQYITTATSTVLYSGVRYYYVLE